MPENYTPPGSSVIYTVPKGTDTADGPKAFQEFADSVDVAYDALTVSDHLADWTLADFDEGTMLAVDTVAANADVTVTVPDDATVPLRVGFTVAVANVGGWGFKVKLAKGPGVIIQDQGFLQVEDYRITTLVKISANFWLVQAGSATHTPPSGPTWATISAPAASGQYTDADGTWDYYEFTASGTLTVDTAGFADVLVVGGGGGAAYGNDPGDRQTPGGGGAVTDGIRQFTAATHTVTIGGGGSVGQDSGGAGGASSLGNVFAAPGIGGRCRNGRGGAGAGGSTGGWETALGLGAGGTVWSTSAQSGRTSSITGTAVEYARGGGSNAGTRGSGGNHNAAGIGGAVIVRVKV